MSDDAMTTDSHSAAVRAVLDAAVILARGVTDADAVEQLQQQGHARVDAVKLSLMVPSAFSWPVLKRLGVTQFPDHFLVPDRAGQLQPFPVAQQHHFTAALTLAFDVFEHGWKAPLDRPTYEAVAARSAEMDIIHKVYSAGGDLQGSTAGPLELHDLSADEM